jgi:WD40 repeat protein
LETGQRSHHLPDLRGGHISAAFSPDGRLLATSGEWAASPVDVWNMETGELAYVCQSESTGERVAFRGVDFSPDGQNLACGGFDGSVRVCEACSGALRFHKPGHTFETQTLALSPDGSLLAVAYVHGVPELWDVEKGCLLQHFGAQRVGVGRLAFSPDGKTVAIARYDAWIVELWKLGASSPVREIRPGEKSLGLAWSPNGEVLATGDKNAAVKLWDVSTGRLRASLPSTSFAFAWSPDRQWFAVATNEAVELRTGDTAELRATLVCPEPQPTLLTWAPGGNAIAVGGGGGAVAVLQVPSGRLVSQLVGDGAPVVSLVWSRDERSLIVGTDQSVRNWEIPAERVEQSLEFAGDAVSPDGKLVVSAGASLVRLHRVENGEAMRTLVSLRGKQQLCVKPNGEWSGTDDAAAEIVYVIETCDGQEMLTCSEFTSRYTLEGQPSDAASRSTTP